MSVVLDIKTTFWKLILLMIWDGEKTNNLQLYWATVYNQTYMSISTYGLTRGSSSLFSPPRKWNNPPLKHAYFIIRYYDNVHVQLHDHELVLEFSSTLYVVPFNLPAQIFLELGCNSEKLLYSSLFTALVSTMDTRCLTRLGSCSACHFDFCCTFRSGVTDFGKQFIQQMKPSSKPGLTALHIPPTCRQLWYELLYKQSK
jgi:hypothetical protein